MLAHAEPPGYRRQLSRARPKLGAFVGVIDEILVVNADPSTLRKQRHTVRWIFERFRDEVLSIEAFGSLAEAAVVLEEWTNTHNTQRPHGSLGWKTPAAYAANWRPN